MNPKIVVIAGQSASGKNDLALRLAKEFNGIVINADSRQIYRDLNIGTAKPIPQKISKDGTWYISDIPHYLYGFASLTTQYNIYKYQEDVKKIIEKNKDKVIFLTGGTGLYIDSVVLGYQLPKTNEIDYSSISNDDLKIIIGDKFNLLNESDKGNRRRLESIAKQKNQPERQIIKHLYLLLDIDNQELKERIKVRVDTMFKNGLVEENRKIFEKYKVYSLPSLQTIGYQEFEVFFKGELTQEQVKDLIITHTNQYTKRQKTWFKRNSHAISVKDYDTAYLEVSKFLKTLT